MDEHYVKLVLQKYRSDPKDVCKPVLDFFPNAFGIMMPPPGNFNYIAPLFAQGLAQQRDYLSKRPFYTGICC